MPKSHPLATFSQKIISTTTLLYIVLLPLVVLPITPNFFDTNKVAFTVLVAVINTAAWGIHLIAKKRLQLALSPLSLPLLGFGIITLLASFFAANNPADALMGRGIFIPALSLITFIAINTVNKRQFLDLALYGLLISATVLSFISIFQAVGFGVSGLINRFFGTQVPDTLAFTPAGSPIALISFLAPVLIITLFFAFGRKETLERVILFLLSAIVMAGLVLVVVYSFPGQETAPVFLPYRQGYAIALETLKNTDTALLGYGPEQFTNAYNRTRSASLNLTDFWNVRFTSSSNEIFHAVTTLGFLGLAAWAWITLGTIKGLRAGGSTTYDRVFKVALAGVFILLLLIPATTVHIFTFFIMAMLLSLQLKFSNDPTVNELDLNLDSIRIVRPDTPEGQDQAPVPVLPFAVGIPLIIISFATLYYAGRAYAAEMTFKQSLDAAAQNDGLATYNLQREAILQNPYNSRYHRAYSATNLALANSISAQEDISDEDRNNVSQLIQQSIREGKAAVSLDPMNSQNWENLTAVYRSLINVAQNADSWTVASLAQAIQNDPVNPRLRLELGGVYYALGRYDQAIRLYQQAAELKPDWANAYYNLSAAHQQKGELAVAFDYLRQVLRLVEPDTADYTRAQEELEALAQELNVPQEEEDLAPAQGDLQTPDPVPSVGPEEQVELPEGSGPEELQGPQEGPTPTPAAGPDTEEVTLTPAPSPTPAQ